MVSIIVTNDQLPFILGVSFLVAGSYFLINSIRGLSKSSSFITILKVLLSITLVGSSIRLATLGYSFMEIL